MKLLCKLGLHKWVTRGTIVWEDYKMFGPVVRTEQKLKRCRRCGEWNTNPMIYRHIHKELE